MLQHNSNPKYLKLAQTPQDFDTVTNSLTGDAANSGGFTNISHLKIGQSDRIQESTILMITILVQRIQIRNDQAKIHIGQNLGEFCFSGTRTLTLPVPGYVHYQ